MQKILSLLVVASMATPFTFAASGDTGATLVPSLTGAMTTATSATTTTTANPSSASTTTSTTTATTTAVTPSTTTTAATQLPTLGENKAISCSTNPAFGANSCDQCFDGGTITTGKKLTGLFDTWTNNTTGLMIAYQWEQKKPNVIAFGTTKWSSSPIDESKVWTYGSDVIWTPTQSGSTKMQYILGAGQKIKFYEADLGAGYTLEKTDRKNGELVGMVKYPIVFHSVDAMGNEGAAKTHYECVAYNLSAPAVAPTPAPITPAITKTETGPAETIILIIAAFFVAFGLMFSLRKRI